MRITRLQLRNVRRHADLDLALAPGLTVVRGPNESGKSTIQRAIELALTKRVTSGSADLDAMRSWNAGDDDRPWVRIEFEQDDADGDGVRTGTWRILVGDDAHALDEAVRADPLSAYGPDGLALRTLLDP